MDDLQSVKENQKESYMNNNSSIHNPFIIEKNNNQLFQLQNDDKSFQSIESHLVKIEPNGVSDDIKMLNHLPILNHNQLINQNNQIQNNQMVNQTNQNNQNNQNNQVVNQVVNQNNQPAQANQLMQNKNLVNNQLLNQNNNVQLNNQSIAQNNNPQYTNQFNNQPDLIIQQVNSKTPELIQSNNQTQSDLLMQQNQHMKQQDIMMQQLGINTTNDINTQNQQDLIQQLGLNKPSEPQVQQNQNQLNQELMMQQLGLNNNTPMNSESQQSQDLMMQQMLNTPRNQESQQSQDLMMQQMLNNSQSTTPVLKTEPVNSTGTPQFSSAISPPQQHQTIPNNQQFLKQVDASGNTAQFNTKNQAFPNQFNSFDTHTSKSSENYSPPNSAAMEPSPKPPVQVIASPAMTDSNFSFTNSKDIEILQKKLNDTTTELNYFKRNMDAAQALLQQKLVEMQEDFDKKTQDWAEQCKIKDAEIANLETKLKETNKQLDKVNAYVANKVVAQATQSEQENTAIAKESKSVDMTQQVASPAVSILTTLLEPSAPSLSTVLTAQSLIAKSQQQLNHNQAQPTPVVKTASPNSNTQQPPQPNSVVNQQNPLQITPQAGVCAQQVMANQTIPQVQQQAVPAQQLPPQTVQSQQLPQQTVQQQLPQTQQQLPPQTIQQQQLPQQNIQAQPPQQSVTPPNMQGQQFVMQNQIGNGQATMTSSQNGINGQVQISMTQHVSPPQPNNQPPTNQPQNPSMMAQVQSLQQTFPPQFITPPITPLMDAKQKLYPGQSNGTFMPNVQNNGVFPNNGNNQQYPNMSQEVTNNLNAIMYSQQLQNQMNQSQANTNQLNHAMGFSDQVNTTNMILTQPLNNQTSHSLQTQAQNMPTYTDTQAQQLNQTLTLPQTQTLNPTPIFSDPNQILMPNSMTATPLFGESMVMNQTPMPLPLHSADTLHKIENQQQNTTQTLHQSAPEYNNQPPNLEYHAPPPVQVEYSPPFKKQKQNPEKEHVEIWPSQENMMLGEAVEKMGKKWDEISKMFVNRTPSQCEAQWKAIQPRRGKWSPTEDQSLLAAYHSITEQDKAEGLGANTSLTLFWFKVASLIPGRSGQQCMARYLETLDPKLKKGKWDPEEDQLLNEGFQLYGKSWVKISAPIQGRTQRQCRTRWLQLNKDHPEAKNIKKPSHTISTVMEKSIESPAEYCDDSDAYDQESDTE